MVTGVVPAELVRMENDDAVAAPASDTVAGGVILLTQPTHLVQYWSATEILLQERIRNNHLAQGARTCYS